MSRQFRAADLRPHRLFVAAPTFGGVCTTAFTRRCLDLSTMCRDLGVAVRFMFVTSDALITRARNVLVDEFLRSDSTHLFFIDADTDFDPTEALSMLALNEPVSGAPCPKKVIAWERVLDAAKLGLADTDPSRLARYSGEFVFNATTPDAEMPLDEPVAVEEVGTGFMLVRRAVFEQFRTAYPSLAYRPDHSRSIHFGGSRDIHLFFQADIDPDSRRYLSEDFWFCQRVRRLGVPILLCPWVRLAHVGQFAYEGAFGAHVELSRQQTEQGLTSKECV